MLPARPSFFSKENFSDFFFSSKPNSLSYSVSKQFKSLEAAFSCGYQKFKNSKVTQTISSSIKFVIEKIRIFLFWILGKTILTTGKDGTIVDDKGAEKKKGMKAETDEKKKKETLKTDEKKRKETLETDEKKRKETLEAAEKKRKETLETDEKKRKETLEAAEKEKTKLLIEKTKALPKEEKEKFIAEMKIKSDIDTKRATEFTKEIFFKEIVEVKTATSEYSSESIQNKLKALKETRHSVSIDSNVYYIVRDTLQVCLEAPSELKNPLKKAKDIHLSDFLVEAASFSFDEIIKNGELKLKTPLGNASTALQQCECFLVGYTFKKGLLSKLDLHEGINTLVDFQEQAFFEIYFQVDDKIKNAQVKKYLSHHMHLLDKKTFEEVKSTFKAAAKI